MRFMMMYKPARNGPPTPEHIAGIQKLIEEEQKAGTLIDTQGLLDMSKGARVRIAKGKVTVIDGPYVESKELIGGYAIFQLPSKAAAIESATRFLKIAGDGEVEVRQMDEN